MFFLFLFRWSCYFFFFFFVCSVVVLHLVLWWFFPLLVFAFYMHPPCMRVALACSTIPWSYTFHVSIDYDGGRKLRERERGGSGSEGEGRRVEGWMEGRRRWKEMEPGEEKAKRMQTHISWKDCTSRQDRCFWQQREFTSVQTIFFY